jgi:hypothetical protein
VRRPLEQGDDEMSLRRSRFVRAAAAGAAIALVLGVPSAASAADENVGIAAVKKARPIGGHTSFDVTTHDVVNHSISAGSGNGYWQVSTDGGVFAYGDAQFAGSAVGITDSAIVGIAKTPSGKGYWLASENGAVFAFGDAKFSGSAHDLNLNAPIVGIATAAPNVGDNDSYYLVAADGGVFAFGDAEFYGSAVDLHHDWWYNPVLGLRPNANGTGYWESALDGGVFAYGAATFHGSANTYNPEWGVIGIESTPGTDGYWQVGFDGGVFSFGDAQFYGSGGHNFLDLALGMASTHSGHGYWTFSLDGSVRSYGDAIDYSGNHLPDLNEPVIGQVVSGPDAI